MSATFDLDDLKRRMQASIASLKHEFGGLRTGRAAASLVEPVHVEAYGQSMPLNQVATISIPEARMIQIQVWDKAMVIAVDKAIRAANLGLTPTVEGQILRVRMPELNEQRRKELAKQVNGKAEDGRVSIRNIRRNANDSLKKAAKDGDISEDEERRALEEVEKLTSQYIDKVEALAKDKERELLEV